MGGGSGGGEMTQEMDAGNEEVHSTGSVNGVQRPDFKSCEEGIFMSG